MLMKMKFWKNPNVAEAKRLEKLPEYSAFARKLENYRELQECSEHFATRVDSLKRFGGIAPYYEKIREDFGGHLDKWKESSDVIFKQEIGKQKGELVQGAAVLLEKAEAVDEKSEPMVSLEKANVYYRKIGKRLMVTSGVVLIAGLTSSFFPSFVRNVLAGVGAQIGALVLTVGGFFGVIAGLSLKVHDAHGQTIETLKKAIAIVRGKLEEGQVNESSQDFWKR